MPRSPALLLTAGLGTRLEPLTWVRAKPAVPVAGEPLVRRIVAWLRQAGFTDLVLNLHHLPETITRETGDGGDLGVRLRYSWEHPAVLGSAGGPRQALDILGADSFLIVNGDTLTDFEPGRLVDAHQNSGALVTLALVANREPLRYGGVRLDGQSRVAGFVARGPAAADSFHFIGVQMARAAAFRSLERGVPAQSIGGLYDRLILDDPNSVRGVVVDAAFWDIGTLADYRRTSSALGSVSAAVGRRCNIDPAATILDSILWDDVVVGAGARLDQCVVTDGVEVPAGAVYRRSVLVRRDDRLGPLAIAFEADDGRS